MSFNTPPSITTKNTGISKSVGQTTSPADQTPKPGNLPWAGDSNPGPTNFPNSAKLGNGVSSAFFPYIIPDPSLWDKLVDYRLIVIDTADGNRIVGGDKGSTAVNVQQLGSGTLQFTPLGSAWEFFLPISPQQLSITDTYSINTSATLRGILEEHSGVRFKNISIQGTFGVWPGRPSITSPPGTPSALQSIFGGTIAAAENVASQFTSIVNNITTGSSASKPKTVRPDNSGTGNDSSAKGDEQGGFGTGFYQQLMLQQFLEQYAEAKKDPDNASWRLVFDIPKQSQSFVVTPVAYNWNQNVNKPLEVNYSLQLKAWRRIDLENTIINIPAAVTPLTPGVLQRILNTIQAAQNTAAAAVNLIGAVRSDVDNVLNVIRQTGLLVKQLAGVAIAVSDLPAQLVGDTKSTISTFLATVSLNNLFGKSATDPTTLNIINNIKSASARNEGLSTNAVSSGQLGNSAATSLQLDPTNAVFAKPLQYPLLFNQVPVSNLTLNSKQQKALQTEINNVNSLTVDNLKTMRATIQTLCTQLASSFGAGSSYYSNLYNQPQPSSRTQPMTMDEFDILASFYDLLSAYDVLTATNQLDNQQILNNMEFVGALAATSGINFTNTNSKIQVPVPANLTMEGIAERYLGDSSRWLEIATLNDLQEPYLDFNGFQYELLSNADGRNIVVGIDQDLSIGQTVYLYANGQVPTARTIINIVALSQTSFLITLDGLANLSGFTTANQAYIQAYLPGTVNDQNVIWIPSNLQSPVYDEINIPTSIANVELVGMSKVDFLLDNNDLAITNSGDFRLAAGIPNIMQSLSIKLGTKLGSSLLNPDFGLSVAPGVMVSDTSASDIYNQINALITADPRFSGINGLQVTIQPPGVLINMAVQLAGIKGVFPVGFQLPTTA